VADEILDEVFRNLKNTFSMVAFPRRSCVRHSFDSPAETNLTFRRRVRSRVRMGVGGQDEVDQGFGRC
jgi:hypothetical protein